MNQKPSSTNYNKLILVISILIPVVVAVIPYLGLEKNEDMRIIASINAVINSLTAICLIFAVRAIRKGNQKLHKNLMISAIVLGAVFLLNYVVLHSTTEPAQYGGEGIKKTIYFVLLISHILLSICVLPFVLVTFARGLNGNFEKHKKIAKVAFPIWLYVSLSGVAVYALISPYY